MGRSTDKTGIALFIDTALRCGMRQVVCSPGSRNAPLVIAMDLHPDIETLVIHDERVAAFYALGMSIETGQPVGVVCTSGSAMLNYYPAVAEAFYQEVPLIVMSADRPLEWVNHGDGQTIVQMGVYANHIRGEYAVSEHLDPHARAAFVEEIKALFAVALGGWKGPLHFNFPITEPMYGTAEWVHEHTPFALLSEAQPLVLNADFVERWTQSERRMILCGQQDVNPAFMNALADLADDSSLVVLVENTANVQDPKFVHCIDRALSTIDPAEIESFQPDVLITFGGAIISKRIKSFLRASTEVYHCRVGASFPEMDTYRALQYRVEATSEDFARALVQLGAPRSRSLFGSRWKQRDIQMQDASLDFIEQAPYSDLSVFHALLDFLPEGLTLHMGNSSVVRYCQLFEPAREVRYRSNRGASGIDGSLSTACGAAFVNQERMHVAFIGDVSFFYDSNALWTRYLGSNLRIVLINNGGGGIFRIIDGPNTSSQLEKYFEAAPPGNATDLCKAFGVHYQAVHSMDALCAQLPEFYTLGEKEGPQLLEIFTPAEINDAVLKQFFKQYAQLSK